MPVCRKCGTMTATANVRRTKLGYVCKEKIGCERRTRLFAVDQVDGRSQRLGTKRKTV